MQQAAQQKRDKELKEVREKKCALIAHRQPVPKKFDHFTVMRRRPAIIGRG